jgi:hypothetical protein
MFPSRFWVTALTNEHYTIGVKALQKSLSNVGSSFPLVILYTDPLDMSYFEKIDSVFLLKTEPYEFPRSDTRYAFERFRDVWI